MVIKVLFKLLNLILLLNILTFNCDNLIKEVYRLSDLYYIECIEKKGNDNKCDQILYKIDNYTKSLYKTCGIEIRTC